MRTDDSLRATQPVVADASLPLMTTPCCGRRLFYNIKLCRLGRLNNGSTKMLPHQPSHLKLHRSFRGDLDTLEGFWILGYSRRSGPGFKDAKISEFQTIILTQLFRYLIKECLHDTLNGHSLGLSTFRNPIDQFFLCNGRHRIPHFRKEKLGTWIQSTAIKTLQLTIQQRLLSGKHFFKKNYANQRKLSMGHQK